MTGAEVKQIRAALGAALGRRLSQLDLGLMMGLADENAARLVRHSEDDGAGGAGGGARRVACST
jgi:hypothetical protein